MVTDDRSTRRITGDGIFAPYRQVLIQVANQGTDHRAQVLSLLNDPGVKTVSQHYIFYVYDHPGGATKAPSPSN
jgi:uncharacterized damage-inducible protein DinB